MRFETVKGRKNKYGEDRKLLVWARGEPISFSDIFKILKFLFENEDRIYPPSLGYQGREKLVCAICDLAMGMSIEEVKKRHQI